MATTSTAMAGINGTKVEFPFTFPYLKQSDIKVKLTRTPHSANTSGTASSTTLDNTKFTFANATTIKLSTVSATDWQAATGAPLAATTGSSGWTITGSVLRDTDSDDLVASFYPGSAIRSGDLNDNFTQNLYVTQEAEVDVDTAVSDAATALTTANTAKTTADTANDNSVKQDGVTPPGGANSALTIAETAKTTADAASTTANAASAAVSSVLPYSIVANCATLQAYFDDSDPDTPTIDADDIFELTSTADIPTHIKGKTWAQSTAYKVNDRVFVNSKLYKCTVAGTSHGSGTGPSHGSSTATDGGVTWLYESATDGKWTINNIPTSQPDYGADITVKLKFASGNSTASVWTWQSYYNNDPEQNYLPRNTTVHSGDTFRVDGSLALYDGNFLFFGDDADFRIDWDNTNGLEFWMSTAAKPIKWRIAEDSSGYMLFETYNASSGNTYDLIKMTSHGTTSHVELYYHNVKKFETTSAGVTVTGDIEAVDLTLSGDLTVNGTTTTVDTTNLNVQDPLIKLAKDNGGGDTLDIGFYGLYDATGSQDV